MSLIFCIGVNNDYWVFLCEFLSTVSFSIIKYHNGSFLKFRTAFEKVICSINTRKIYAKAMKIVMSTIFKNV